MTDFNNSEAFVETRRYERRMQAGTWFYRVNKDQPWLACSTRQTIPHRQFKQARASRASKIVAKAALAVAVAAIICTFLILGSGWVATYVFDLLYFG